MRNIRTDKSPAPAVSKVLYSREELLPDIFELSDNQIINDLLDDINANFGVRNCIVDNFGKHISCVHLGNCSDKLNCFRNGHLQKNVDFHKLQFHPEDRIIWCEEVFPDILRLIDSASVSNSEDYSFIFNLRYIREDKSITQFIHIGKVVFVDNKLLPDLQLNAFFETDNLQLNNNIAMTIYKYSEKRGFLKTLTKKYERSIIHILTDRELEVIRLCYKGLSSKMIAEQLNISIHTVKNHKRNCMEKTMTHNIVELLHICLKNKWL